MNLAIIFSRASLGIDAPLVTVEVHISNGLPSLSIVGLPETAIKESKDRVRSAIINSKFEFPTRRITINLAPADLPKKDGGRFDLPIALGILVASQQISAGLLCEYEFGGELALDGGLRSFVGALPFALATRRAKRKLIVPWENADEASLVQNIAILPAKHLLDVCAHFTGNTALQQHVLQASSNNDGVVAVDMADVRGQQYAKRALEIAAAGQHSMLMTGSPGTGKTMLANCLLGILPDMSDEEALEVAAIKSICGKSFNVFSWRQRLFRAPHHTASGVALVGGSSPPRPGEISLAHNGVLFLDELPEFNRGVLETLREPMESGCVTISRAAHQAKFPARFQLIAAMNPCPCGNQGNNNANCRCTSDQIQRYQGRISGPLLDRIDLHVTVPALPRGVLTSVNRESSENSAQVKERVMKAKHIQMGRAGKSNAVMQNNEVAKYCGISEKDGIFLENAVQKFALSARAYHRLLKVARTIADLEAQQDIRRSHLAEALSYRGVNKLVISHS